MGKEGTTTKTETQSASVADATQMPSNRDHFVQFVSALTYDEQVEALRPQLPIMLNAGYAQNDSVQMSPSPAPTSIEDRARAAIEWTDGRVAAHIRTTGLAVDPEAMWIAAFKAMETGDMSDFNALVATIPFRLPNGPLILWSGEGAEDAGKAVGTDINSTDLGVLLKGLKIDSYTWPNQQKLWESISARFSTAARGEVHIFLGISSYTSRGGIRPESVFGGTEKETIEKLQRTFPAYAIRPIYHCVVQVSGAFAEPIGPFSDSGSVPEPRSLFWATGKASDVSKTNDAAHVEDSTNPYGTRPPTP